MPLQEIPPDSYLHYLENEVRRAAERLLLYSKQPSVVISHAMPQCPQRVYIAIGSSNDILHDVSRVK
jgi:hypothetical protein